MKVGTDGVLLGAWCRVGLARRILDIGTGTGLIALMLAQRSRAQISAIDIDRDAVSQARENVEASPWKGRIEVEWSDLRSYAPQERFDAIVSNPPYFAHSLECPDTRRNIARHTDSLDFEALISHSADLLLPQGTFSVILPADAQADFLSIASMHHLYLSRKTSVMSKPDIPPKRVLLELAKQPAGCIADELVIELPNHMYSEAYIALTKDFYLKM